jgi:hypothetical protein
MTIKSDKNELREGGQFGLERGGLFKKKSGGQFGPKQRGQLQPKTGGQFDRNFQTIISKLKVMPQSKVL